MFPLIHSICLPHCLRLLLSFSCLFLVFVFWSWEETCLFSPATLLYFICLLSVKIRLSSPFFHLYNISNRDERISRVLVHHGGVFLFVISRFHVGFLLSLLLPLLVLLKITSSLLSDISYLRRFFPSCRLSDSPGQTEWPAHLYYASGKSFKLWRNT